MWSKNFDFLYCLYNETGHIIEHLSFKQTEKQSVNASSGVGCLNVSIHGEKTQETKPCYKVSNW